MSCEEAQPISTPRNFAEWSRQVLDVHLPYNGGKQLGWLECGRQLDTAGSSSTAASYTAVISLQTGGYAEILLALLKQPPGTSSGEDLRELAGEETEAARAEFRSLEHRMQSQRSNYQHHHLPQHQQLPVAVLKVPKTSLSRQATEKAFRKAMRALTELKDTDTPGVSLMLDYSRQHCIEVYRYYPCDLAAAAREMRLSPMPESFLFFWAAQLAEALTGLHERGILHCDLHPENVLLDSDGNLLLHDFGLSKRLPAPLSGTSWRPRAAWVKIPRKFREDSRQFALLEAGWWPPELAEAFRGRDAGGHMNNTVDWYGLGATLFFLRTGSYPMRHFTETQLARMLERPVMPKLSHQQYQKHQHQQQQQQQHLTPNFSHFLLQLLRERITDRLGHAGDGREVLSHVCVRSSPLFRACDSWEQRRELIRSRQLPAPYRIVWGWPEFVQRLENCRLPRLA